MTYKIKEVFPTRDAQAFVDIVKMDAELFPNSGRHLPSSGYWWIAYNEKNKPVAFAGMTKSKQKHHAYAPVRKWADGYNMNYWRRYEHPPGRTAVS